jgi:2-succinyl-5-enolpyruvyl-6-hydroxy-3-cyclohexene-1-carboxylate synthase
MLLALLKIKLRDLVSPNIESIFLKNTKKNMIVAHKNVRILLSLLKQHNIRYFVMSPGGRNMSIVKSIEDDPFFTCYSVVDERSAAYFAVGLSLQVGAPVAMSCTSAQATRNYLPGMTEAFYRKAPILAITADYDECFIDQQNMQALRQMSIPVDVANVSVDVSVVKDHNDEHLATRRINEALDALTRNGGGPAHINIRINEHWIKGEDELEVARKITRYILTDQEWPSIGARKVLLVVGQHHPFSEQELVAIEEFAEKHDVGIYVNHISNYNGLKSVHGNIRLHAAKIGALKPDLIITIGGHLGDYRIDGALKKAGIEHWRVGEDGNYADTYNSVTKVFECAELCFFARMASEVKGDAGSAYFDEWVAEVEGTSLPDDFELSHALVAQSLSPHIPDESNMHFAILNSLRFWEFFSLPHRVKCYSNVAAFGIDGCLSTFLGQSVASDVLNFLIVGDLSFFYDMNAIGIHHIKNNVRILLVNNNGGCEFRLKSNAADRFGDNSNCHIAAAGHFGDSAEGWVRNNDFKYLSVRTKEELDANLSVFVGDSEQPILMEVFTTMHDDAAALQYISDVNDSSSQGQKMVKSIKAGIPRGLKDGIKGIMRR